MSVHVEITIAPEDFKTRRHLEINRITNIGPIPRDLWEQDPTFNYEVILTGNTNGPQRAEFEHSYRDDVLTLIIGAIVALRVEGVVQA